MDLDGELEAMRREARKKLDEDAELEKRLSAFEPGAGEIAPAPAVSEPRASVGRVKTESAPREDDHEAEDAEPPEERLAREAKAKALNLATRAILEGPEAMVKGGRLGRRASGLSLLQKLSLGVVGMIALVVLWKLVFQPLLIFAIVIGICAILVLAAVKLTGKGGGDDDDDEKPDA